MEVMWMLIVTHEMGFEQNVADRIVFMDKGAIIEENTPQEFFSHPKPDRARAFLNIIDDYEVWRARQPEKAACTLNLGLT